MNTDIVHLDLRVLSVHVGALKNIYQLGLEVRGIAATGKDGTSLFPPLVNSGFRSNRGLGPVREPKFSFARYGHSAGSQSSLVDRLVLYFLSKKKREQILSVGILSATVVLDAVTVERSQKLSLCLSCYITGEAL